MNKSAGIVYSSSESSTTNPIKKHLPSITKLPFNTILLLILSILSFQNLQHIQKLQIPPTWEYRIESIEDTAFERTMQAIGSQGWEVASARRAVTGEEYSTRGVYEVIFKRQKQQSQEQKSL